MKDENKIKNIDAFDSGMMFDVSPDSYTVNPMLDANNRTNLKILKYSDIHINGKPKNYNQPLWDYIFNEKPPLIILNGVVLMLNIISTDFISYSSTVTTEYKYTYFRLVVNTGVFDCGELSIK